MVSSQTWPMKLSVVSSKQRSCRYCYMDAPHGRRLNGWRKSLTAIIQVCCEQYWACPGNSTPRQLYCHLPRITKTIKRRRTRHAGHYWRSRDELVSNVHLWTPSFGRAKAGRPAITYIQQLCADTGCSFEDLPKALDDRDVWRERVRDIRAYSVTWWWWWFVINNYSCK